MMNKTKRNICLIISVFILLVMITTMLLHTYEMWKYEPKYSEIHFTFFELIFEIQKGALLITVFATFIPFTLGLYYHFKK